MMNIRKYKSEDCREMAKLFYDTVHKVNIKDYSKAQVNVWATGNIDISSWDKSFLDHNTIIAEENGVIVGFGDMDSNGYLDRLYVHKDHQGKGIATWIVHILESKAGTANISSFTTHASITAKPFFEKCGYKAISKNRVVRDGVELINFMMKKIV